MSTGTTLHLKPFRFRQGEFAVDDGPPDAPILWYALFSPAEIVVDKTWEGECYGGARTTAELALKRIHAIERVVKNDVYLKAVLAPLGFVAMILKTLKPDTSVEFNLYEFWQSYDPQDAMNAVRALLPPVKAFTLLRRPGKKRDAVARLRRQCLVFNGSLEKDRKVIAGKAREWGVPPVVAAMRHLVGGPTWCHKEDDENMMIDAFEKWAKPREWIWEGGEEDAARTAAADASIRLSPRPEPENPVRGVVKRDCKNGPFARLVFRNGMLNGRCTFSDGDGYMIVNYRNGKRNGLAKFWSLSVPDGHRWDMNYQGLAHYKNDLLDGIEETDRRTCLFRKGRLVR